MTEHVYFQFLHENSEEIHLTSSEVMHTKYTNYEESNNATSIPALSTTHQSWDHVITFRHYSVCIGFPSPFLSEKLVTLYPIPFHIACKS